ncbi:sodium/calcium exchanger Calx-like isoform X2 [Artemia franciscana]|uniref:sodium/calcium exchanger Calx-like isoform X2 n=1 Tax=Artemia franciscana TaxID=6661 RepID=UPI0032DABA56
MTTILLTALVLLQDMTLVLGGSSNKTEGPPQCEDGLIIPMWRPSENLSTGDRVARGLVYFIGMVYLFIGVSIVADKFMASIEVITSKEKEITIKRPNGDKQIVVVRVWNETVANLTLMALGSSAPEILLSIIEIYAKNYEAGDLGPGTIVGSAAFNLFMIIGLCVYVIPDGEVRKIKHLRVFFVTATWSVFAYIWLYIILAVISYGVVEVWEGLLTLMFFPATVYSAYFMDKKLYKFAGKRYRMNRRGMIVEHEGDVELGDKSNHVGNDEFKRFEDEENEEIREFEEHRREFIRILRELRKKNPNFEMKQLEALAREEMTNSGPKSRAFYRIQATRKLTGGCNLMKKTAERVQSDTDGVPITTKEEDNGIKLYFDPGHYTVMENVGEFFATVRREGGDLKTIVHVDYKTEDGSANAGSDYVATFGTLTFGPCEVTKSFSVKVIDDDVFEEDEHFYLRISNVRLDTSSGLPSNGETTSNGVTPAGKPAVQIVAPSLATVMILDDDHCGIFNLAEKDIEIVESVGTYDIKVVRWSGARGRVVVPYKCEEGTAKPGKDYSDISGELTFENNETEKFIQIQILEEDSYEKDVLFYVELGEPRQIGGQIPKGSSLTEEEKIALLGLPKLGDVTRVQIRIKESKEFKNTVDKLLQRANASLLVGTSSWKEQFLEALTVSADDDDENGEGESPSCTDYVLHFLTLFWKVLFAFVPPTDLSDGYWCFTVSMLLIGVLTAIIGDCASHFGCTIGLKDAVTAIAFVALGTSIPDRFGGWLCFCVAIIWIGILTAVIGDVASAFGCSVGLKDSITAIAFVALGTSVPDTFASKVAAVQDKYADASIGNVTGSNAVNVFLGIGIAWSIAAVKHAINGRAFIVPPGNLAFSVTLFCTTALCAIAVMLLRRTKRIGGELGGPRGAKIATSCLFVFFWLFYVFMSSLEAYGVIQGF